MGKETVVATYLDGRKPPDVAELHARLGVLTAFLGGILFEIDRDGRYLAVMTGHPELLAFPMEQLHYGLTVTDVIGEELGGTFVGMFRRVLDTGTPESFDYTLDVPAGRRNFHCEARALPSTTDPTRQSVTLLVQDMTLETELKAKLVEAERLAAMGLVAASVGHEIRQPLAFATTSLEVLARELGGREGVAREALDHVRDAIRRIGSIAASVGVVAAPDRSQDATTDVRRPIEAAIDLCASELQGRARVTLDIPELPRVRANEGELCQVVANLLLNAAQAITSSGSRRVDVTASLVDPAHVRISIADDGCGIDPAYVARVFDPFFTTKEPGRGTGLGLFVSKRIVEHAGGTLSIESRVNEGTTVHVVLPVAMDSPMAPLLHVTPPRAPRLRVLVIDDETAFLRSLELMLGDAHDVVVCGKSKDALALLQKDPTRFDVILCDLSMPDVDGVAFYNHVQQLGVAERFVLMTAGAFTLRGEEFIRKARCHRIDKPFTFDELVSVLKVVTAPLKM